MPDTIIPLSKVTELVAETRDRLMAAVPDLDRYSGIERADLAERMTNFSADLIGELNRLIRLGDCPVVEAILDNRDRKKITLKADPDELDKVRAQHFESGVALVLLHPKQFDQRRPEWDMPELPFPPLPAAGPASPPPAGPEDGAAPGGVAAEAPAGAADAEDVAQDGSAGPLPEAAGSALPDEDASAAMAEPSAEPPELTAPPAPPPRFRAEAADRIGRDGRVWGVIDAATDSNVATGLAGETAHTLADRLNRAQDAKHGLLDTMEIEAIVSAEPAAAGADPLDPAFHETWGDPDARFQPWQRGDCFGVYDALDDCSVTNALPDRRAADNVARALNERAAAGTLTTAYINQVCRLAREGAAEDRADAMPPTGTGEPAKSTRRRGRPAKSRHAGEQAP